MPPHLQKENIIFKLSHVNQDELRKLNDAGIAEQIISKEDLKDLVEKIGVMAHTVNLHQEIHFDMLELINCELMNRPTFKQALESFRQVVPTIFDARLKERLSKKIDVNPPKLEKVPSALVVED